MGYWTTEKKNEYNGTRPGERVFLRRYCVVCSHVFQTISTCRFWKVRRGVAAAVVLPLLAGLGFGLFRPPPLHPLPSKADLRSSVATREACIGKIQQVNRKQWTVGPVLAASGVTKEIEVDCYQTQACGWDTNTRTCGHPNAQWSPWQPGDKTVVNDEKECPSPG